MNRQGTILRMVPSFMDDLHASHTQTQDIYWLNYGEATVTIWHLNTTRINWFQGVNECVCEGGKWNQHVQQQTPDSASTGLVSQLPMSFPSRLPDRNHISVGLKWWFSPRFPTSLWLSITQVSLPPSLHGLKCCQVGVVLWEISFLVRYHLAMIRS